jgi:hypothetical protein
MKNQVWRLVANHVKAKAPSAVRAVLTLDPSTSDLTGATYNAQGQENAMIPTKANPALVSVMIGRMRDRFVEVHRITVELDLSADRVKLTTYGLSTDKEKIRSTEEHAI